MFIYQQDYIQSLKNRNVSNSVLDLTVRVLCKYETFLKSNNCSVEPQKWNTENITAFYRYLCTRTYFRSDNRKTGFVREMAKRNWVVKNLCKAYIYQTLRVVKQYLSYLIELEVMYKSPFDELAIRCPAGKDLVNPISEKDIETLIRVINPATYRGFRDRTIIELIYGTGLRLSEISKLDIEDVDLKECVIKVRLGKGKKDRIVPIGEVALSFIKEYLSEVRHNLVSIKNMHEQALFLSLKGKRFFWGSVGQIIHNYAIAAGVTHISTHKLRHAFSIHMLQHGCDIRYIQEILGHSRLSTTEVYTKIFDDDLKEKILKHHPCDNGLFE